MGLCFQSWRGGRVGGRGNDDASMKICTENVSGWKGAEQDEVMDRSFNVYIYYIHLKKEVSVVCRERAATVELVWKPRISFFTSRTVQFDTYEMKYV